MSQDTFPFAEDGEATPYVEEGARNRKALLVAGGVAAALVVGAGGWLLLSGGGGDATAALVPHGRPPAAAAAVPKPVVKPAKKLPAAYTERLGRDPFKALYVVRAAAPAAAPVAPTSTTAGTSGTSGTSLSGTSANTTSTRYTIKLLSISKPSPETRFTTWSVGGTKTTVIPAQRFGKYGELVVLAFSKNASGVVDSAIIQVGDDSPVDVKIGDSISVL
ncbi:MAG: hypothetical protein QOJ79_2502 [Actinomycetota bacterium]|jgi:hypothetical protein|nr:hypothetical protein [Actinomycetota bacterium]